VGLVASEIDNEVPAEARREIVVKIFAGRRETKKWKPGVENKFRGTITRSEITASVVYLAVAAER